MTKELRWMVPEAALSMTKPRRRHDPRLPGPAALRRILSDEPTTTVHDLSAYYEVSESVVRRTLREHGLVAYLPPPPRKLPPDPELRTLLIAASDTGFGPLMRRYQVTAAALSKAKKRLGVDWKAPRPYVKPVQLVLDLI